MGSLENRILLGHRSYNTTRMQHCFLYISHLYLTVLVQSGYQLRRCLIGRPVDGRYSENGKYLPPSAERFWLIPALGQVWPEKTQNVDVPEPSIPYNEVLLVLNSWVRRFVPTVFPSHDILLVCSVPF